ncbi:MAG TPA: DISARM system helicase DrmA [Streptosporangiaceae bacterium]|nr:DISARM system helicase DrmA [Streptosporangiaceae bacterium]
MTEASQGELPSPLEEPQEFAAASSYQVRDELAGLIERDLLGPWDGELEVFPPRSPGPCERYLVGRLGPRHDIPSSRSAASDVVDTELSAGGDAADGELPDLLTMQNAGRMWASSMGLSFVVPSGVDELSVTASWGRYGKAEVLDEAGNPRRIWSRGPVTFTMPVRLDGDASQRISLTGTDTRLPGVYLAVEVRPHGNGSDPGARVVELGLVNAQDEPPSNKDTAWLLQPRLTVSAVRPGGGDAAEAGGGAAAEGPAPAVFCPIDDPLDDLAALDADPEDRHLRLLYRNTLRHAVGRNVAVHAAVRAGERRAYRLETNWLPTYDVPATIAPPAGPGTHLAGVELSMDELATLPADRLASGLAPLASGYEAWLDEQEAAIPGLPEALREAAAAAVFTARRCAGRIRAGIDLLTVPGTAGQEVALAAFRFANEAMALQRRHTEVAELREGTGAGYAEAMAEIEARGAQVASWWPFQLAFILLNLPALTDPAYPDRAQPSPGQPPGEAGHEALVDLLFFPTGGGKTEAYLGLAACTFAIRRLQGVVGTGTEARSGDAGVAVLMRYTLRLLTAQQFQRAAALVCAAEKLRRDAVAGGDPRWGAEPFRIGLWVGGAVSPNWYGDAEDAVADVRESGGTKRTGVLQTLACPWCGSKLLAHRDLRSDPDRRRIMLYCPAGEGPDVCPFSEMRSPEEGLPILTVDEEIYRYAPSLLIATVDKLAQLPWRGYAGILFGRVRSRCPRHGYRHDDLDTRTGCGQRHNVTPSGRPAVTSQPVPRLRPPDLIVQDELHLISGALGTTVGLFEAAVDELCTWCADGVLTGPKIVASTATTKRAREQVRAVFGRDLAVFPPPVLDIADTFFSRQVPVTPAAPGRRYLGICAHGVRLKSAEIRLSEILLIAGQTMFDRHGPVADPYLTVVGYFNATRELAGMRRYLDDDVTTRVRSHGRRRGLSDRITSGAGMLTIEELTSRISSAEISNVLKRLESGFVADLDTSARRRAISSELAEAFKEKRDRHPLAQRWSGRLTSDRAPVDVVLATSMLQVGVDVRRFGLMVVTGQPKNTAEYIQASSRVGRDTGRPGLVVTLYNWSRPRDLAHYEDFGHYHATFYRQVEALSVTPYTRRSLDRGTAATFVAAVRNSEDAYSRDEDAQDVPLDGPVVQQVTERFLDRAGRAGGQRGREYLSERIGALRDRWELAKTGSGSARLGYRDRPGKQPLRGLLKVASGSGWTALTVPMSMRETENDVNLLIPGAGLFEPVLGQPAWSFGARPDDSDDADGPAGDDVPEADELGESAFDPAPGAMPGAMPGRVAGRVAGGR